MITVRPSEERGGADHGWLKTRFTFSFDQYYDPKHMGFRSLRVINDDRVAPGAGFPMHPHRNMEIITYMLAGELAHKDSMGNGSTIQRNEVQRMTAGKGILHSEFNPSQREEARLLQIWLTPRETGLTPSYGQRWVEEEDKRGKLALLVSRDGREGSLKMEQDSDLYAAILAPGQAVTHELAPGRHAWLQVAQGVVELNGTRLAQGDGAAVSDEARLAVRGVEDAEVLLFDLN